MRDILTISELVTNRMPGVKLKSIAVNDYFAVVKADIPKGLRSEETTLRLYELKGVWKIRGCAFSAEDTPAANIKRQSEKIFENISN